MNKKILVIDDNEQDKKILKRHLKAAGYEDVFFADSGEEGVRKVQGESPDLVICDTILPGIHGFEVCKQIKDHAGERTKVIVTTGHVDAVDAVEARKSGADEYMVKTSDFSPLLHAIESLIGKGS